MAQDLGTLLLHIAADARGMKSGTKEAADALKKVQSEAQQTREAVNKAFAGQEVIRSFQQFTSQIKVVHPEFARVTEGIGHTIAASLQFGQVGFIISGLVAPLQALTGEYVAAKQAILEAQSAAAAGHNAEAQRIQALADRLKEVQRETAIKSGQTTALALAAQDAAKLAENAAIAEAAVRRLNAEIDRQKAVKAAEPTTMLGKLDALGRNSPFGKLWGHVAGTVGTMVSGDPLAALQGSAKVMGSIAAVARGTAAVTGAQIGGMQAEAANKGRFSYGAFYAQADYDARLRAMTERAQTGGATWGEGLAGRANAPDVLARREAFERSSRRSGALLAIQAEDEAKARAAARFKEELEAASEALVEFGEGIVDSVKLFTDSFDFGELTKSLGGAQASNGLLFDSRGHQAAYAGGQAVASMSKYGGGIQSMIQGDMLGGIIQMLAQSKAVGAAMEQLDAIIGLVVDEVGMVFLPLIPILKLFAAGLKPIMQAIGDLASLITSGLMLPLMYLAAAFKWVGVEFGNIILKIKAWVADLLPGGETGDQYRKQIVQQGGFFETMAKAGEEYRQSLNDTKRELREMNEGLNEVTYNLPAGFKVNLARFSAQDAEEGAEEDKKGSKGKQAKAGPGGGPISITINNLTIMPKDPGDFWRKLMEYLRRQGVVLYGIPTTARG